MVGTSNQSVPEMAIDNVGKTIMGMVLEQFYHISMGGNPTINQNMNSITINSLLMWVKQCHKPPHDWEWLVDVSRHLYIIIYGDLGDGLLSFYPYYYTI